LAEAGAAYKYPPSRHCHSLLPPDHTLHAVVDTSAFGDICEGAVAVVAVENILKLACSCRLWCLRIADEIDIQQTIAVIVDETAATAHGLDQVSCAGCQCFQVPLDTRRQ